MPGKISMATWPPVMAVFKIHGTHDLPCTLKLYGFALCLSSVDEKSINYYFVSNNLS